MPKRRPGFCTAANKVAYAIEKSTEIAQLAWRHGRCVIGRAGKAEGVFMSKTMTKPELLVIGVPYLRYYLG